MFMDKQDTQQKYQQILVQEAESLAGEEAKAGAERRGAPRVSVVCGEMAVNSQVPVSPVNISVSGACFFAERPFPIGSRIEVSIAGVFTVQATVVNCAMEESSSELMEFHYRVHCRFDDEDDGLELLVLAKEREGEI
jgi:hypothetical protein